MQYVSYNDVSIIQYLYSITCIALINVEHKAVFHHCAYTI